MSTTPFSTQPPDVDEPVNSVDTITPGAAPDPNRSDDTIPDSKTMSESISSPSDLVSNMIVDPDNRTAIETLPPIDTGMLSTDNSDLSTDAAIDPLNRNTTELLFGVDPEFDFGSAGIVSYQTFDPISNTFRANSTDRLPESAVVAGFPANWKRTVAPLLRSGKPNTPPAVKPAAFDPAAPETMTVK